MAVGHCIASVVGQSPGGGVGYFLVGNDRLVYALIAFVVIDYLTGVMCAAGDKKLFSAVGFKGIYVVRPSGVQEGADLLLHFQ